MERAMSATESQKLRPVLFEGVTPILRVRSVGDSVPYYVQCLGFKVDWETPGFVSVSRDKCHIFLCEGDQGHFGTWIWLGVEDAESLFHEYQASGARVRHPPNNYAWAYEMQVEDPDGNVLRLGSEPREDQPIGEWLDMQGVRWLVKDGKWIQANDQAGSNPTARVADERPTEDQRTRS
jgi:catechol 2,3-dioxygenase-like lactoylglutathione lyase family enzyme